MKFSKLFTEQKVLIYIYSIIFFYLIFQPAIYTPDSSSYVNAAIHRSPGYAIIARVLKLVFNNLFNTIIVAFQIILSLFSIHIFFKTFVKLVPINLSLKLAFLLLLFLPLFKPLEVANNICSEGLSYPLYLLFLGVSISFINQYTKRNFIYLIIISVLLSLTRGQFIILPIIVGFIFIIKNRDILPRIKIIKIIIVLTILPIISSFIDKTYHLLKDGEFVSTPYSYIGISAATLYISNKSDADFIFDNDTRLIFKDCYEFLHKNNWLMSLQKNSSWKDKYIYFHKNLGNIANYTLHDKARAYYIEKGFNIVQSNIKAEKSAKTIFKTLFNLHFKDWLRLFYQNLVYGFKHPIILFIIVFIIIISLFKLIKKPNLSNTLLLYFSLLILSNAMIVAFASHSIVRYNFYNYSLIFILILISFKNIKLEKTT